MISKIKLYNFRSYSLHEATFSDSGTVIVGPNGTGKTNLLEAVYVALRGSSFRGSLSDCMTFNTPQTIIHLEGDFGARRIKLNAASGKISKEFIINDNKSKALTRKNRLPVVLFEPSELRLISSSPSRRRDFLDGLIARLDSKYDTDLRAFNRTLLQRNELLKSHQEDSQIWRDNLFAWDIKFVQYATNITQKRAKFLQANEPHIKNLYESLAGKNTQLSIEYSTTAPLENYDQSLLNRLEKAREYEIATGFTSVGPHREDFTIFLHDQPAIKVASRGEMRTIMLAFKLLELELQTEISQSRPLILLDDVFSELDATREKLLQETIQHHQFIVTTTDARHQKDGCLIISTQ
ncbi:DNA replication and repair protein RecF [Candidatus Nanosynbacter sp. TM7-074]|uniref:DNA replication and repair protein RecF n=1 Tax=Candidatus Nanosynbacter sp. TM7-074 TaxID=3158573 RepID=A0AB39J6T1_9BACT